MFENNVYEKIKKLDLKNQQKEEFCILTHKKHGREIYFIKSDKKAIKFMKFKFKSPLKMILYYLIKFGLAQPFLKKIKLNSGHGQLIFVGGQIKIFNFLNKEVISFPKYKNENKKFIKSKEYQRKLGKKNFAPKINTINKILFYSKEELLEDYNLNTYVPIFKKLIKFYFDEGIKKISVNSFINYLKKRLKKSPIKDDFFTKTLDKIKKENIKLDLMTTFLHGDLSKEQVLKRDKLIVLTDWNPRKGLIIDDLVNFFRGVEDLLNNKEFCNYLKLFPKEVQKNIGLYLILNEINFICDFPLRRPPLAKIRIKNLFPFFMKKD